MTKGRTRVKITVLIENTSSCGFPTEHGLSLFVETAGRRFLFDMGQSGQFARNAEKLGVDLRAADFAVLSHGHYDHGGGIETFLKINDHAPVYMSRYAFEPHYNGAGKYIGLDRRLMDSPRIVFTEGRAEIAEGVTLDRFAGALLLHQTCAVRLLARTGFYQNSGAFGFRDQLQDCANLLEIDPSEIADTKELMTVFNGEVVYELQEDK